MKRHVVAGMIGLALAGCAQDRSTTSRSRLPLWPVEMTPPMASINEEIVRDNPQVDPESVRAGHPADASNRPPSASVPKLARGGAAAEPGPASAAATASAAGEAGEPGAAVGRPSTSGPYFQTGPRPRFGSDEAKAALATTPAPADAPPSRPDAEPEVAKTAETDDAPRMQPGPSPAAIPAVSAPGTPAPVEPGPTSPAPGLAPTPAPPATEVPDGRVRIEVQGDAGLASPESTLESRSTAPPPTAPARKELGRDPLLGPDPDIMPSFDARLAPRAPKARDAAPPTEAAPKLPDSPPQAAGSPPTADPAGLAPPASLPAPAEVEPPPSTTLPLPDAISPPPAPALDPAAPAVPEPAPPLPPGPAAPDPSQPADLAPPAAAERPKAPPQVRLSPPDGVAPAPGVPTVKAAAAEDSAALPAVADQPSPDPLLGANPEIMPMIDLKDVSAPAGGSPRGARPAIRPQAGLPPSVRDLPGNHPRPFPAPDAAAPAGAAPEARAGTGPADPQGARVQPSPAAPAPPAVEVPGAAVPRPAVGGTEPARLAPAVTPGSALAPAPMPTPAHLAEPADAPVVKGSTPASAPAPAPADAASGPAPAPAPKRLVVPKPVRSADPLADPVDLPPLSDSPAAGRDGSASASGRGESGFASVPVSPATDRTKAPEEVQTPGSDPTAVRSEAPPRSVFEAGKPAARVGDDVITIHELKVAVTHRRQGMPADRALSRDENYMLARQVLNDLVDRSVVLQEAKHELKSAKQYKLFMDMADKVWLEDELPPMLRKKGAANIYELKDKLAEKGESLDEVREQYRLEFLARGFLEQKLGSKMKVDLPEMRDYYMEHLKDFALPAQVTWREVLVEVDKSKSRADARRKAEALLARLQRGEDFATVAKAESDGPTKSAGGLWRTAPGSYAGPAVNAALESLPAGKISPLIEGAASFHIVRVESRRKAGPATFAEVQDQIRRMIRQKKVHAESEAYLDKLRKRTVITTVFDDPGVTAASAVRVGPGPAPGRPPAR